MMPMSVRCLNCGGEFDPHEPKCPYCGSMYEPGAEKKYMETLGEIREDMEDLNSLALSETGSEFKSVAKKTVKTVLIIIAVIAGLLGLSWLFDNVLYLYLI